MIMTYDHTSIISLITNFHRMTIRSGHRNTSNVLNYPYCIKIRLSHFVYSIHSHSHTISYSIVDLDIGVLTLNVRPLFVASKIFSTSPILHFILHNMFMFNKKATLFVRINSWFVSFLYEDCHLSSKDTNHWSSTHKTSISFSNRSNNGFLKP